MNIVKNNSLGGKQPPHIKEEEAIIDNQTILRYILNFISDNDKNRLRSEISPLLCKYETEIIAFRFPIYFDPVKLKSELSKIPREKWEPQIGMLEQHRGTWKVINLRSPYGDLGAQHKYVNYSEYENTEILNLCPYYEEVVNYFKSPLMRIRLSLLEPGGCIALHTDICTLRFHVPIEENELVSFIVNNQTITMREGELWYFDSSYPHSVYNMDNKNRIHMLIDAVWDERMRALFPDGMNLGTLAYFNGAALRHLDAILKYSPQEKISSTIKNLYNRGIFKKKEPLLNKMDDKHPKLRALILAAGRGGRLMPYTARRSKCLVEVSGKPILSA